MARTSHKSPLGHQPAGKQVQFDDAVRRTQAFAAFKKRNLPRAYSLAKALLKTHRSDGALLELAGTCAARLGRFDDAEKHLTRVLKLTDNAPLMLVKLGQVYAGQGRYDEALALYDRALAAQPGMAIALSAKASTLERRGDTQQVRELLEPIVQRGEEDPAMAIVYVTALQSDGEYEQTLPVIHRHLANADIDLAARSRLAARLARACEKLDRIDEAFAAFAESNRLLAEPFDRDAYEAQIDELINTFSEVNLSRLPRPRVQSQSAVFIASLPRSGSTLTEQIIHAHPKAFGAGEINEFAHLVHELPERLSSLQMYPACLGDFTQEHADALAREYDEQLRGYGKSAKRVVNKHLDNWMHLGMVSLLCPQSKVIHVRRNPLDNCLSIYIAAMNTSKYAWSTDLESLGVVYREHERLMQHWHDVLDVPILSIDYEDVVENPETWIRRIIEFCDLPWDERCLRYYEADRDVMTLSYDQVRRPIYKSAANRAEKYREHLLPLRAALGLDA